MADLVARRRSSPFVYAYLDPRHRLLAGDDVTPADAGPGWLRFEAPALARDEREPRSFLGRAVRLGDGGLLVVARDVDEVDDFRETLLAGAAWTVAATLLLAVGVGALMGRFVLGRIDAVTATAARIVAGDLGHRVPLSGSGDEFDRLAAQINAMLDRIGGLMAGLRQVTDDVAHDLRTPLGRLRNRLEAMLRHDDVAEGLREETAQALAEADGMLDTFGALLRIAEIEGGTSRAGFREVDLSRLVGGVVEGYAAVAEDRGQTLAAAVARDVRVRGDPELLTQLLVNLVENGLRHTPPGSTVTVTLARGAAAPPRPWSPTTARASPPATATGCCAASPAWRRAGPRRAAASGSAWWPRSPGCTGSRSAWATTGPASPSAWDSRPATSARTGRAKRPRLDKHCRILTISPKSKARLGGLSYRLAWNSTRDATVTNYLSAGGATAVGGHDRELVRGAGLRQRRGMADRRGQRGRRLASRGLSSLAAWELLTSSPTGGDPTRRG